jgi:hypothetical protein
VRSLPQKTADWPAPKAIQLKTKIWHPFTPPCYQKNTCTKSVHYLARVIQALSTRKEFELQDSLDYAKIKLSKEK